MGKVKVYNPFGEFSEIDESELIDRSSAYGIYLHKGKILMVRDSFSKKWSLPGGEIEEGETHEQAVIREFEEETGLRVKKVGKLIKNVEGYFYFDIQEPYKTYRYFYPIEDLEGELLEFGNNEDTIEAKFFSLNEEIDIMHDPHLKELLQTLGSK